MGFGSTKSHECVCRICKTKRSVTGAEMALASKPRCYSCGDILVVESVKRVATPSQQLRTMTCRQLKALKKTADANLRREIIQELKDRTKSLPPPIPKKRKGVSDSVRQWLIQVNSRKV